MPWSLLDIITGLPAFALVLFRLTGLMLTAPVIGSANVPMRIRGALVLTGAAMMFPILKVQAPAAASLSQLITGAVGELMVGAGIGLALTIFMLSAEIGGLMIGRQAGIALSQVFDPTTGGQTSTTGQLFSIVLVLVFLVAGGLRATMAALMDTFTVIPLMAFRVEEPLVLLLVEMMTAAFMLGIRLAGPVLIALFLTGTAMGFLSRTMPQFNILSVGFAIRVLVAVGLAGVALMAVKEPLIQATWEAFGRIRDSFGLTPLPRGLVG